MEHKEIHPKQPQTMSRIEMTTMTRRRRNPISAKGWLAMGSLVAFMLLLQLNPSQSAVIKRENGEQQDLVTKTVDEASSAAAELNRLDSISRARAIDAMRNANRISAATTPAAGDGKLKRVTQMTNSTVAATSQLMTQEGDAAREGITAEPMEEEAAEQEDDVEAGTNLDDAPIPTFAPFDINRYTSSYHDDGVAESEPLRAKDGGGGGYTTVDYEQRFERIELTTPSGGPYGMFRQEAHRFDVDGVRLEDEQGEEEGANVSGEDNHRDTAAVEAKLDAIKGNATAERNSTAYFNNVELESTRYDIQADEANQEAYPTTTGAPNPAPPSQKRGKYLQNPEEEPNFSLPSTADVWALAAMKNVEHTKTKAGVYYNNTVERNSDKEPGNGTSQTKILTDWLEIMKNSDFSNDKFLANDIPEARDEQQQQQQPREEAREENKVVEVVVTPPPTPSNSAQRTTTPSSVRRFDETSSYETTTEFSWYNRPTEGEEDFSIHMTGPGDQGTRVSDNLYYEDFTTDLPDFLTTTESPSTTSRGPVKVSNIQQIRTTTTTERAVMATTEEARTTTGVPTNEINTVPNESSFDRKTTEAVNDIGQPLKSTTLSVKGDESGLGTTEENPNIMVTGTASPTTEGMEQFLPKTTDEPPRIIPLIDAGFAQAAAEEVLKRHQSYEQGTERIGEEEEKRDQSPSIATLKPIDITNNSIEKAAGAVAAGEAAGAADSNSLPEYTIAEQPSADGGEAPASGGGVGRVTTPNNNNNGNYLEAVNTVGGGGGSQSSAPATTNNDHEDDQPQYGQQRPDYVMTTTAAAATTTGVTRTAVRSGNSSGPTTINGDDGESGAAAAAEQSNINAVDVVPETSTTARFQPPTTVSQTMEATTTTAGLLETKTTTTVSSERIELEQRRTNGHQVITHERSNGTLEVSHIGLAAAGAGDEVAPDPEGRDVNAIIAITVSVIAVAALVLLVGFLYVMRKRQKQLSYGQRCQPVGLDAYSLDNVSVYNSVRRKNNNLRLSKRSYGNSAFEDPGLKFNNLSIQGLAIMVNNKDEIREEFKEVPLVTARVDEVPPGCEDKNRYANVVPLPETRVHLQQLHGDEKSEYINANYVRGPKDTANYYVACQAPMDNTIVDFWRMIWEQNSKVVCQLTDLTENGIEKCAEYLPPSVLDTNRVFGDFSVTLKNREIKDKYAVSTVHLRNAGTNTWREITHFWYQWPEDGMPMDETSVIAMLLEVRSYLKMAMPEQVGRSADDPNPMTTTVSQEDEDEGAEEVKQKKIQELNDELTEKLDEQAEVLPGGERKANGTIDKSKSLQRTQGPLTVHCSPGTGRTGTIIGCDIALRSLEMKNRSVDVPQIVYYVRRGRASSIKTLDQYEFIYRCANTYAQKLMEPIVEN